MMLTHESVLPLVERRNADDAGSKNLGVCYLDEIPLDIATIKKQQNFI